MVNTRQIMGPPSNQLDETMRTFINESISTAIENVTRSIQEQLERTVTVLNTSVNGVCLRQDALAAQFTRIHGENMNWEVYVEALLKRFSSTYEDPMSELKNIRQKGGLVQLYIDAFDVIMTKVEIPE
ncbi:putative nucleotidyltransferase, ribonuclease H [Tanacetum coccineum]